MGMLTTSHTSSVGFDKRAPIARLHKIVRRDSCQVSTTCAVPRVGEVSREPCNFEQAGALPKNTTVEMQCACLHHPPLFTHTQSVY